MHKRKLLLAALAVSSIGVIPVSASAAVIWVDEAPPAPQHEVVPAPRHGYVWAPGYYDHRHGHYTWVKGHWEKEHHGEYWHPHRWVEKDGRWTMEKGGWHHERYVENHGDRDHDGVPNRVDRAPDNPHRQ